MLTEEETWSEIDHKLVSLKLHLAASHLERDTEQKRQEIIQRHHDNIQTVAIPIEIVQLELKKMEKCIATTYRVYREVWRKQGNEITPEFVKAVIRKGVLPEIENQKMRSSNFLVGLFDQPARAGTPMPETWIVSKSEELAQAARKLSAEWQERMEIAATELEHAGKRSAQRSEVQEKMLRSRRGRKRGRRLPQTVALDKAIGRAKEAFTRENGRLPSTKEIATLLANSAHIPLPAGWRQRHGIKSWCNVLNNPRLIRLAAKRFTKVKPPSL